jgi:hypothetical protein
MYSINNLKTDLENSLHGTTLNSIQGINQVIQRASSQLLFDLDAMETKRTVQLASPIYDKIYDYALPVDVKGEKIIDLKPQVNRTIQDNYSQAYNTAFDIAKGYTTGGQFSIEYNQGVKTIRINSASNNTGIVVNQVDSITGNGVWTVSGLSNLQEDNLQYVSGSTSLKADMVTPNLTGYFENSTMTAVDLSDHKLQGQEFVYVYLPLGSAITSVSLAWGSSPSNYWTGTKTLDYYGNAFQNGWNLIGINYSTATKVGSPDVTKINFAKTTFVANTTNQYGIRMDNIVSQLGVLMNLEYYSKYMFKDAITGAFQESITDDSNIINLDTETRNLLFLLTGKYAVQQIQGINASYYDDNFFSGQYANMLAGYKAQYKSEWRRPQGVYYKQTRPMNRRYLGQRMGY